MPVLILSALDRPSGRSLVLLIGWLVALPGLLSFWWTERAANSYNVCFVGPADSTRAAPTWLLSSTGEDVASPVRQMLRDGEAEDSSEVAAAAAATAAAAGEDGGEQLAQSQQQQQQQKQWLQEKSASAERLRYHRERELRNLYGAYRTFDGTSYFYVKTTLDVTPTCLYPSRWKACGWPSASTLGRNLSPRGMRKTKDAWKIRQGKPSSSSSSQKTFTGRTWTAATTPRHEIDTIYDSLDTRGPSNDGYGEGMRGGGGGGGKASSIAWDRGGPSPSSIGSNRWCISGAHLPPEDDPSETPARVKICSEEVPSIVVRDTSSSSLAEAAAAGLAPNPLPHGQTVGGLGSILAGFPELPLSPPPDGIWSVVEVSLVEGMGHGPYLPVLNAYASAAGEEEGNNFFDDMEMHVTRDRVESSSSPLLSSTGSLSSAATQGMSVRVRCHQRPRRELTLAAGGKVELGPWDESMGYMTPPHAEWNLLRLPATTLLMALCCLTYHHSVRLARIISRVTSEGHLPIEASETILRARAVTYGRVAAHPPSELWRCAVASFHHASATHLLLVLWNLYWIGATLEADYGPLPYLYLHISLTIVISVVTLVMVHMQMITGIGIERGTESVHLRTRAVVVGYLPVVVAWSVAAASERSFLHPIPGVTVPTLVFAGGYLKFNALPALNLVLASYLAPKSSAVSHFAGGYVGLIVLHWDVPAFGSIVPQVLIPLVLLLHRTYIRGRGRGWCGGIPQTKQRKDGYSPVPTEAAVANVGTASIVPDDDGDSAAGGTAAAVAVAVVVATSTSLPSVVRNQGGSRAGSVSIFGRGGEDREGEDAIGRLFRPIGSRGLICLYVLQCCTYAVAIVSLVSFDHGSALGQWAVALLFHGSVVARRMEAKDLAQGSVDPELAYESYHSSYRRTNDGVNGHGNADAETDHVLRYHFISASVLVISDAASAGAWIVTHVFVMSDPTVRLDIWGVGLVWAARMIINLLGIILNAAALKGGRDENTDLLGPGFRLAEDAGTGIVSLCRGRGGGTKDILGGGADDE